MSKQLTNSSDEAKKILIDSKNLFWKVFSIFWLFANYDFLLLIADRQEIINNIKSYYDYKSCGNDNSQFLSLWCGSNIGNYLANLFSHILPRIAQPLLFASFFVFVAYSWIENRVYWLTEKIKFKQSQIDVKYETDLKKTLNEKKREKQQAERILEFIKRKNKNLAELLIKEELLLQSIMRKNNSYLFLGDEWLEYALALINELKYNHPLINLVEEAMAKETKEEQKALLIKLFEKSVDPGKPPPLIIDLPPVDHLFEEDFDEFIFKKKTKNSITKKIRNFFSRFAAKSKNSK